MTMIWPPCQVRGRLVSPGRAASRVNRQGHQVDGEIWCFSKYIHEVYGDLPLRPEAPVSPEQPRAQPEYIAP